MPFFRALPMFVKVRYVCLSAISLLIIWQVYTRLPSQDHLHMNVREERAESLKTFKEQLYKSRVTLSVYYEALCPDSRSFFVRHLLPVYTQMGSSLEVELIPYGHAKTTKIDEGKFEFECQHGPAECFGNKIHSCAILNIEDPLLRLKYVTCLIDSFLDPEKVASQCAEKFEVPLKAILQCANGTQGDWLLKNYGERTDQLSPTIGFVPTILLNNNHHKQSAILKNLHKELCSNYKDKLMDFCS